MLFCCIVVFQYGSSICHCRASVNTFETCRGAYLTISKVLALIKRLSVPHVKLQESARWKDKTRHVFVPKSMDAATAGDHWRRCRPCLQLQLPLSLYLILDSSLHSEWICNDRVGCWIRGAGRQVFKTAERSGSDSNAWSGAGYNATCWGSSGCWCATTACTWHGGWSIYRLSLCSGQGESHTFNDICKARIVQWR